MKKVLSLILAAIMLAAALVSCASVSDTGSAGANIRLTSSDAADAAGWLNARLGEISDRLVIGTATDGYGVDVSALEDDGYIIRRIDGEIALFARTADGLDRAVRRYAKAVEANETVTDETYHEGFRIKDFRLAGNPISSYAIRVESDSAFFKKDVTDNAAYTLSHLIGIACGFEPEVGGEAEHYIVFRQIDDPAFRESSYNYHFEGDDLVIGFIESFGAKNGAVMFLQNECGWVDLISGFDELEEHDLLDIPADLDVTAHPLLAGGLTQCTSGAFKSHGATLANVSYYMFNRSYRIPSAHHALGATWAADYGHKYTGHLPCLTSDEVFEDTSDEIAEYIQNKLDAGEVLGEGIAHIDLGMEDENNFCHCKTCNRIYVDEGGAWAGPMVYFANRIEQEMDSRGYDKIKYSIFAYAGSNPPPRKIKPNDDIYVTLVLHDACDIHYYDGSQCTGSVLSPFMISVNRNYTGGAKRTLNNEDWGAWIRGWNELGAHLYIRVATLTNAFEPFATMYVLYDNMKFFAENGCMAIYNETYAADGLDFNYIVHELYQIMQYNPGISRADYFAEYYRLLEKYYGDGWRKVLVFADDLRRAELAGNCRSSWSSDIGRYDYKTYSDQLDGILESLDRAIYEADSARQEYLCKMAKCAALYMGCLSRYYFDYNEEDEAALASDRAMWDEMISLLDEAGYHVIDGENAARTWQNVTSGSVLELPASVIGVWGSPYYRALCASLDDQAWIVWDSYSEVMQVWGTDSGLRRMPEEYLNK